jgi:hypothetical protein
MLTASDAFLDVSVNNRSVLGRLRPVVKLSGEIYGYMVGYLFNALLFYLTVQGGSKASNLIVGYLGIR